MGRKKFIVKRLENLSSRQATYSKRKDAMMKKANELSVLCDAIVALLMFSPNGEVTTFASSGRVEDIFLSFLRRPDQLRRGPVSNENYLTYMMEKSKIEANMIEKMAKLEVLKDTLYKLNHQQYEAREKLRYYNPDVENLTSLAAVGAHQKFLENALQRVNESQEKLFLAGILKESDDISEDIIPDKEESPNADHESPESNTKSNI